MNKRLKPSFDNRIFILASTLVLNEPRMIKSERYVVFVRNRRQSNARG